MTKWRYARDYHTAPCTIACDLSQTKGPNVPCFTLFFEACGLLTYSPHSCNLTQKDTPTGGYCHSTRPQIKTRLGKKGIVHHVRDGQIRMILESWPRDNTNAIHGVQHCRMWEYGGNKTTLPYASGAKMGAGSIFDLGLCFGHIKQVEPHGIRGLT